MNVLGRITRSDSDPLDSHPDEFLTPARRGEAASSRTYDDFLFYPSQKEKIHDFLEEIFRRGEGVNNNSGLVMAGEGAAQFGPLHQCSWKSGAIVLERGPVMTLGVEEGPVMKP